MAEEEIVASRRLIEQRPGPHSGRAIRRGPGKRTHALSARGLKFTAEQSGRIDGKPSRTHRDGTPCFWQALAGKMPLFLYLELVTNVIVLPIQDSLFSACLLIFARESESPSLLCRASAARGAIDSLLCPKKSRLLRPEGHLRSLPVRFKGSPKSLPKVGRQAIDFATRCAPASPRCGPSKPRRYAITTGVLYQSFR